MAKIAEAPASGFERRARHRFTGQNVLLIFIERNPIQVRVGGSGVAEIRTGIQPHIEHTAKLGGIEIALIDESDKWNVRAFQRLLVSALALLTKER